MNKAAAASKGLEQKLSLHSFPVGEEMTGSEIYRYTLEMLGMEKVLAYTGGRVLHILDKLGDSKILDMLSGPHEQDIGHAAQAYFKITRKPANVIVTSGPGGTNCATPLKDAQSDSDGVIFTIGQVPLESLEDGEESFQGADMISPYSHWSKWACRITNPEEIQSVLKTAYAMATTDRPGPITIEFPGPVQMKKAVLKSLEKIHEMSVKEKIPHIYTRKEVQKTSLEEIARALQDAKRPVIYAGGGIYHSHSAEQLEQFAEQNDIPYVTTLMLLGAMKKKPLNIGFPGMHGRVENNLALHNADVILTIGARLDDRIVGNPEKFAPGAEIYWIEPHFPGIGRVMAQRVKKIEIDAQDALEYLTGKTAENGKIAGNTQKHTEWKNQIQQWKEKYPMPHHIPREVIEQIRKNVDRYEPKEPYVATGVGAHQMFLAEYWTFNPEEGKKMLLSSGGLGTMGTGTPFGIGALLAEPDRPSYVFNGDGSFIMDQRSLLMAWQMREKLKQYSNGLKEIVFRDNTLGMVDHWQNEFYGKKKVVSEVNVPDDYFKNSAKQNEFAYFRASYLNEDGVENAKTLENFVKHRGNALLEIRMFPESVFPMIPGGKSIYETILPGGKSIDKEDLDVWKKK